MAGHLYALVAQSVEHLTFNQVVGGSIPLQRTTSVFAFGFCVKKSDKGIPYILPTRVRILLLPLIRRDGTGADCTLGKVVW